MQNHGRWAIIILLNEYHQVPFDMDLNREIIKNKEKDLERLCPWRDRSTSFIDLPINFLISDSSNFSKWPTITQNIHKFPCVCIMYVYPSFIYIYILEKCIMPQQLNWYSYSLKRVRMSFICLFKIELVCWMSTFVIVYKQTEVANLSYCSAHHVYKRLSILHA